MQNVLNKTSIILLGKRVKKFCCPDLYEGRMAILDIYLRIMCFFYPLYLSDTKILEVFTEKELVYYLLTLLTALLVISFFRRKTIVVKKPLCRIDCILFFLTALLIIKGSIRFAFQEVYFYSEIFFLCLIITIFLLKSFSGNLGYYLNLILFSAFFLYLDMLYQYLTERQGFLGSDIILRQPEAASWLLLTFGISSILYEKECRTKRRIFYLLVSIMGIILLFLFGDTVAICLAGIFLLSLPLFYQPSVNLIKRNLTLCFSFLGLLANLPLLQYLTSNTLHDNIFSKYGIYIDFFLLCLAQGIRCYWKKIPTNRNPETVLLRKFQKWYKQVLFIIMSFGLLFFVSGNKILNIPDKLVTGFVRQLYIDLSTSIYINNSFVITLFTYYGIIVFILWIYLLIEVLKILKKYNNKFGEDKKTCLILSVMFLFHTFFYHFGPFNAPISIILLSFALSGNGGKEISSSITVNLRKEAYNEKSIVFDKCGPDEILS